MSRIAPTHVAAIALVAASLACAGCPMCHNTSKCPKLTIGYGTAGADDGAVHIVGAGLDETFQWGDDAEKDDVVCNAMLDTHATALSNGIALGPPKGAPHFATTADVVCYRRSDQGAHHLFGVKLCLGDLADWTAPRTFDVTGGFDPFKLCAGSTVPAAGGYFQDAKGASCWGPASVRVVVERVAGTRMDYPDIVSADFVRAMRIELTMTTPMTGTVGGKPDGTACTGPAVTGSARLVMKKSDVDYQPDAICPCLG